MNRQQIGEVAETFATGLTTQKGPESGAHEGLMYGRNERGPQYFHEWVNWYVRGDSSSPKPVLGTGFR